MMAKTQQFSGENIRTVIWDLDGTLLDSFGLTEEALSVVLPLHGLEVPAHDVLLHHYHGSLKDLITGAVGELASETMNTVIEDFLEYDNASYDVVDKHLFPDAVRLAQVFAKKGARQILVTNRIHGAQRGNGSPRAIVANSTLREAFSHVICGDDGEYRKPLPEVINTLPSHISVDPTTTIIIGDQFVDAQFAHNLGTRAILVNRHGGIPHLEKLGNNWQTYTTIVETLDDVLKA